MPPLSEAKLRAGWQEAGGLLGTARAQSRLGTAWSLPATGPSWGARYGGPMAPRWSVRQVLDLAPDASSAQAARRLANPRPWSDLGCTQSLVWGKCNGSAKSPYQVVVDLAGPSARCTCPSRKFPCKHGLALLLLWATGQSGLAREEGSADDEASTDEESGVLRALGTAAPGGRARRSGGPGGARRTTRRLPPGGGSPEAKAKRAAEREATMSAGLDDFGLWLSDLAREGLAAARRHPYSYWDTAAARLVDAQVPGLADRARSVPALAHSGEDWAELLLGEMGRWFTALQAWRRRHELEADLREDLRTFLGVARRRHEVEAAGTTEGRWILTGVRLGGDERLRSQRTWLWDAEHREWVLLLDFAAAGATLEVAGVVGAVVEGRLALYPGAKPVRGLLCGERRAVSSARELPATGSVRQALALGAEWLAANPFLERFPASLAGVTVAPADGATGAADAKGGTGLVVDGGGDALPLASGTDLWPLLALTGGEAVDLFGEVEGGHMYPVTVAVEGRLVGL